MRVSARTFILLAIAVAAVAGLLFVTFRTEPVAVDLAAVERGTLRVTVDADGKTRIRDIYEVAAPISGLAKRSPVEVGDRVVKDETVVAVVEPIAPSLLDSRTRVQAEATVREVEAALRVAETDLQTAVEERAYAQSQFDRVQALVQRGVASVTRLEDAAQHLAIAKAAVEAAQAKAAMGRSSLERARAALIEPGGPVEAGASCCVEMLAPETGVVLSVDMISERPVTSGARLLSVGDPTHLQIVGDLLSSDAVRLEPGAEAIVERWGGPEPLRAILNRIEPSARTKISALGIEEQRVDAIFDLASDVEERAGLGHGFAVFLRIVEWQEEDVLLVPLSALFRRGDAWSVYVAENGIARERPVALGRRNGRQAVVLQGLEENEAVVTHPSDAVADGVPILDRAAL